MQLQRQRHKILIILLAHTPRDRPMLLPPLPALREPPLLLRLLLRPLPLRKEILHAFSLAPLTLPLPLPAPPHDLVHPSSPGYDRLVVIPSDTADAVLSERIEVREDGVGGRTFGYEVADVKEGVGGRSVGDFREELVEGFDRAMDVADDDQTTAYT
jgi:hypothetical protein